MDYLLDYQEFYIKFDVLFLFFVLVTFPLNTTLESQIKVL